MRRRGGEERRSRGEKAGSEEKRLRVRRDDTVAFCLNYSGKSVNIPPMGMQYYQRQKDKIRKDGKRKGRQ